MVSFATSTLRALTLSARRFLRSRSTSRLPSHSRRFKFGLRRVSLSCWHFVIATEIGRTNVYANVSNWIWNVGARRDRWFQRSLFLRVLQICGRKQRGSLLLHVLKSRAEPASSAWRKKNRLL